MPCTAQSCRKLTSTAFELVFKAVAFPLHPPTPRQQVLPKTQGSVFCWGWGQGCSSPSHPPSEFFWWLPQAMGRTLQGTSTLRLCQRHTGPCSGLAPRSCSRLLPGAPGQDRGFLVLCSPSARPVLYLGPAAAWAALASSPLPGRGAGGGG